MNKYDLFVRDTDYNTQVYTRIVHAVAIPHTVLLNTKPSAETVKFISGNTCAIHIYREINIPKLKAIIKFLYPEKNNFLHLIDNSIVLTNPGVYSSRAFTIIEED